MCQLTDFDKLSCYILFILLKLMQLTIFFWDAIMITLLQISMVVCLIRANLLLSFDHRTLNLLISNMSVSVKRQDESRKHYFFQYHS